MAENTILLAGFGGQGILFAAKQLALAGMYINKKVTWMPSYGPETRGGASNCTVIISDGEIGAPITPNPETLLVMDMPSYAKFHLSIKKGGNLICDASLISEKSAREDIKKYYIPATSLAHENNMPKLANVIMIGKLIAATKIFTPDELVMSMQKSIPESKKDLLEMNIKALDIGFRHT
ncbi:MAG: 2-oxoacid:acceptor oxidoreductase family protein [Oscillospiraceae bacterium]|nr:2-oxoacid:acceptor oxidoreductase family protein [Oscillospiraceae bacterium]